MAQSNGFLTTHILDTANGCPAQGVKITLYALKGEKRIQLSSAITNNDGRTDSPILGKGDMQKGVYELVFEMGAYFKAKNNVQDLPFIDVVPIRFGIADENDHYHVPLLASPFSFSTYRGS